MTEIWFDIDEVPAPRTALDPRAVAVHPAIGRRLLGLAILCLVLFALATLVGLVANLYT